MISNDAYDRGFFIMLTMKIMKVVAHLKYWSSVFFVFLFFFLFLAVLGLHCCVQAFSSCGEQGLLFIEVHSLLIAVASRCRAWALGTRASVVVARRLSSCGTRA